MVKKSVREPVSKKELQTKLLRDARKMLHLAIGAVADDNSIGAESAIAMAENMLFRAKRLREGK